MTINKNMTELEVQKLLTEEVIEDARRKYLEWKSSPPKQFNIQFSWSMGWRAEFMDKRSDWNDCTLWFSDEDALNIFFNPNPENVFDWEHPNWNNEWNEE